MPYTDPVKAKESASQRQRWYYVRNRKKPEYKSMVKRLYEKWRVKTNPAYVAWRKHSEEIRKLRYFLQNGDRKGIKTRIRIICQCCGQQSPAPFKRDETARQARYLPIFLDMLAEKHQNEVREINN